MNMNTQIQKQVAIVSLEGALDVSLQTELKDGLLKVATEGDQDVVIDFSAVSFIDSSCLGTLVSVAKELRDKKGDLKLSRLSDEVESIFQITRLNRVFEIFDDNDQAVESFYR